MYMLLYASRLCSMLLHGDITMSDQLNVKRSCNGVLGSSNETRCRTVTMSAIAHIAALHAHVLQSAVGCWTL